MFHTFTFANINPYVSKKNVKRLFFVNFLTCHIFDSTMITTGAYFDKQQS